MVMVRRQCRFINYCETKIEQGERDDLEPSK